MDSLEKYIIDHRQEFNNVEPPAELFEGIAFEANEPVTIPLFKKIVKWSARAAAAILIFATAWFLNDLSDQNKQVAKIDGQTFEIIQELKEAEAFYNARITHNKNRIASFASNNPGLMESVNTDLEQLDAVYKELKNDLGDNAANQEVVEAMIQNYRLKLDILEEILVQLEEKSNTNKKESISYEL